MVNVENIVAIAKENHGSKAQFLADLAEGMCGAFHCVGVSCTRCPFYDGDALKEHIVELAGELA